MKMIYQIIGVAFMLSNCSTSRFNETSMANQEYVAVNHANHAAMPVFVVPGPRFYEMDEENNTAPAENLNLITPVDSSSTYFRMSERIKTRPENKYRNLGKSNAKDQNRRSDFHK